LPNRVADVAFVTDAAALLAVPATLPSKDVANARDEGVAGGFGAAAWGPPKRLSALTTGFGGAILGFPPNRFFAVTAGGGMADAPVLLIVALTKGDSSRACLAGVVRVFG
jgi:hypothetical protein